MSDEEMDTNEENRVDGAATTLGGETPVTPEVGQDAVEATSGGVDTSVNQAADAEDAANEGVAPVADAVTSVSAASAMKEGQASGKLGTGAWIGIAVAALVVGVLVGMFVLSGNGLMGNQVTGKTSVPESALDSPIATYNSSVGNGKVTVREAILQESTLEAAQEADGTYKVPSADSVLTTVRNDILLADAAKRGITASDDEITAYAEENLGSSDFSSLAANYGMDEESIRKIIGDSCVLSKLRDQVMPADAGDTSATMPDPPAQPQAAEGEETSSDARTKEYADYIIELAGDEWDAENDTWASTDGPYATALADYEVSAKDGATYDAASEAYFVAYQQYAQTTSSASDAWTDYANNLMSSSNVTINTLVA